MMDDEKLTNVSEPEEAEREEGREERDGKDEEARKKRREPSPQERRAKYVSIFISVIIAVGLWFFVINDENPTIKMTYTGIPLDYLNEDILKEEGLVVANSENPVTVRVVLQGKRSDLLAVKASDIAATVDVSKYKKGDNYADVQVHAPSSVAVSAVKPSQVKITIESLISSDKEVSVVFNGTAPANTEAVCRSVSPEEITVTGASSAVSSVKNLRAVVNLSDVDETVKTLEVSLKPVDALGNEVSGLTLSAESAEVEVQLYSTKTVPLVVETTGTPEPELNVTVEAPESVLISCPSDQIDQISEIDTEPVDITGIDEQQEISLVPLLPDGVRLASNQEKISAVIKVEKRSSKTLKYKPSDVKLANLPEGMTAEISDETISLVIYGDGELSDLTAADFELELDCSALGEEESQATLTVRASESVEELGLAPKAPTVNAKLTAE